MPISIAVEIWSKECVTEKQFSYFSTKTYVVGTQKNRLDETVLLSTQNTCWKLLVRKYLQFYAEISCLFKPVSDSSFSADNIPTIFGPACEILYLSHMPKGTHQICVNISLVMPGSRRGDRGPDPPPPPPPLKNHRNIGFLSNTGPDPLKFSKLPSQHSMLGQHRHARETPF